MNLILGIILIVLSTFIGYILSSKYTEKRIFYQDFFEFNSLYKSEVNFSKRTIKSITENKKSPFYKELDNSFQNENYLLNLKNFSDDEKAFFREYSLNLGKGDRETELQFIDNFDKKIKEKLDSAIISEKNNKSLFIKVGFAFGLILFIAVI